MKLIDIHAHLEHKRFEKDLDKVIARFEKAGGKFVVNSGVNPETNRKALELSEKYKVVKVSFGLYPIDALAKEVEAGEAEGFLRSIEEFDVDEELEWIEENKDRCAAIGECGLDYNWKEFQTDELREKQKEVFRKVLKLAKKIDKPVVVHSRKAEADAIEILEEEGFADLDFKDTHLIHPSDESPPLPPPRHPPKSLLKSKSPKKVFQSPAVIMHSFNGKKALIRRCVENGWFFSVPPVIKRLQHFTTLVGIVPLKQLLTETDAPYLSPVAGERNEPANVVVTIEEIAKIKSLGEEEVGEQIFNNAVGLFGLR